MDIQPHKTKLDLKQLCTYWQDLVDNHPDQRVKDAAAAMLAAYDPEN